MNVITSAKRLVRSAAVVAMSAAVLLGFGATAAEATTWTSGALTTSATYCDYSSRLISVSAYASQMPQYTNGQFISYQIYLQDTTTGVTWLAASWAPWQKINAQIAAGGVLTEGTVTRPKLLGTTALYGTRGHGYRVVVQYDWWTGRDSTGYDPEMTYTEKYAGYTQTYSACWF
jgi:hypothetical protein